MVGGLVEIDGCNYKNGGNVLSACCSGPEYAWVPLEILGPLTENDFWFPQILYYNIKKVLLGPLSAPVH